MHLSAFSYCEMAWCRPSDESPPPRARCSLEVRGETVAVVDAAWRPGDGDAPATVGARTLGCWTRVGDGKAAGTAASSSSVALVALVTDGARVSVADASAAPVALTLDAADCERVEAVISCEVPAAAVAAEDAVGPPGGEWADVDLRRRSKVPHPVERSGEWGGRRGG